AHLECLSGAAGPRCRSAGPAWWEPAPLQLRYRYPHTTTMTRPVIVRALVSLGLLPLIGCGRKSAPPNPPVPVTVGTAERRAVPFELAATGMVEPLQTVAVLPQVGGPLVQIGFTEGQEVKKGQILFQIDARPFRAALDQAEANLARDSATASN